MGRQAMLALVIAATFFVSAANAGPPWPAAERSAFVEGCALGIINPAKRDYAARAEKAGNPNPKPFPEDELRASVETMCSCLADRMVESGMHYLDAARNPDAMKPMIQEAMAGGRCKPGGLMGQALSQKSRK